MSKIITLQDKHYPVTIRTRYITSWYVDDDKANKRKMTLVRVLGETSVHAFEGDHSAEIAAAVEGL